MSPWLSTFFVEAINFLVLAGALGWLLFKPIRRALEAEQSEHAERERQVEARLAEVERTRAEMETQRTALVRELERVRTEAREASAKQAETLLAEARARAAQEREALKHELERRQRAWREGLEDEAAALAARAVLQLLERLAGPELDTALARAACRELQSLPARGLGHVVVESARPLSPEARELVGAALAGVPGVEFRSAPRLGAGLRILTGAGLVDASASGLAAYAERTLAAGTESSHG
jgi:F-type H+-transporting ATPase subunit b